MGGVQPFEDAAKKPVPMEGVQSFEDAAKKQKPMGGVQSFDVAAQNRNLLDPYEVYRLMDFNFPKSVRVFFSSPRRAAPRKVINHPPVTKVKEMENYELMDYQTTTCEKFGFTKNITEFRINPDVGRPDEAMKDAIDNMIKVAIKTAEEKMKRKVRMFGVAITGAGLSFPVWVPYRAYPQNNADVIMEEINKLGQSGDGEENKKMLLLSEPITMKITCVAMPSGEGPRNVHKFDFGFKEHQRIGLWKRCVICDKTYHFNSKKMHECGETYCQLCSVSHDPKRGCYIMPIEEKEDKDVYRIVVWLESLKATFNLDCEDKPFFPYYYNKKENYGVCLEHLPPMEDYSPGSMNKDKYEKFEKWYNENKETPFYLDDELRNYCRNDTEILLLSIIEFRRIMINDITKGFDPLPRSCTNAGVAMNIFKAMFLLKEQLSIVPEKGYERCDRASVMAIKYLEWRSKRDGIEIRHAGNGREVKVGKYKLDGFIVNEGARDRCIEVMGCYIHGCLNCYDSAAELIGGRTAQELNDETQERLAELRKNLEVEEVWGCQIEKELKKDEEMRDFFDDRGNEKGPIDPRMAYAGGRTGPMKLFAKSDEKKKISVYDIVSLYPSVNYGTAYPIGLPEIIIPKSDEINVNWTRPEDLKFNGLYKVRVNPPRGLRIPVLQLKCDERLLFPLCWRCASTFKKETTRCDYNCPHDVAQRRYVATYTSVELAKALECGYTVDRFYRAWHYEEEADDLFKGYVRLFLKLKEEASGFPKGVETEEQKDMWRDEYKEKYGIDIELAKVKKNPGLRTTSMARLKLLEFIREAESHGGEILYTDTDSIFVLHDRDVKPITTGKYLGEMSEEYGGYEIEEYCCGGAKQYALKMRNKQTGEIEYVMKIRGITFDVDNKKTLHYDTFREMVLNYGKGEVDPAFFVYKNDFGPTRDSKVVTREKHKIYKPVCQKGIIDEELNVMPFGFC
ncbi:hypothetical protein niasHT_000462 [Heterodera trifolii]|uniref:DNA-directed DNA polymerase n=1 Tax=Heterodera trifolii TaxID=157864 RepID=A0ABD2M000_9BILA